MRNRRGIDPHDVRIFSGSSNPALAGRIAAYLGVPLEQTRSQRYGNDNLRVQLGASVRARAVYIVQSLTPPTSEHLVELLMMLDAARGAGAREVNAIVPYFSYARSDKKDAPRISIAARLIADLLQTAGATHAMTMTLHSPQVHGFFSIPTDPLTARGLFVRRFRRRAKAQTVVVAPDAGQAKSAGRFAALLGLPSVAAIKIRIADDRVEIGDLVGKQVEGFRRAIVYDDEIATGTSVITVCKMLVRHGIESISLVCTHGLFVDDANKNLASLPQIKEIVATDTVLLPPDRRPRGLKVLSVAPIFGEAIRRNLLGRSIGDLFSFWDPKEQ
jgi:ribose-phosphate pyrophosphokinase